MSFKLYVNKLFGLIAELWIAFSEETQMKAFVYEVDTLEVDPYRKDIAAFNFKQCGHKLVL